MTTPPRPPLYVFDEASAERLYGLAAKLLAAIRSMLDDRRIDLPDEYDVGLGELAFLEDQAALAGLGMSGVDVDGIF